MTTLARYLVATAGIVAFMPAARPADALIRFGRSPSELRISEVSPKTMRLQLLPLDSHGRLQPPPASTDLVVFPQNEKLRARDLDRERSVKVGELAVTIKPQPLAVLVRNSRGKLLQELLFDADGTMHFRTPAPVLGLGEGEGQFDRRGSLYRMINGQHAPLLATHGATIPVPFVIGTDGWAMFIHGPWGEFDLRDGQGRFLPVATDAAAQPLDLFLTAADHPADALAELIRLTGASALPPKWVLGYIQSHRTLDGPQQPLQIAQTFRDKKLPCDALIYLGTGYCTNGWNTGHGSLEFNPNAFNEPAQQIKSLHELNFKVVLHVNHAPRDLFGSSFSETTDSPLHIRNYWTRHREDFELGVDGWWPDDGDELPIEARLARHRCYYEGPLSDRPNVRPWSLHRNAYLGATRYGGWIWSGDTESRWATLAAHVPVGINCSLSLTPFWGTDIGGFVPTRELTGELYVRWFQFGAFNPLFRSHGRTWHLRLPWGWDTGETGPVEARSAPAVAELHNAEVEPICRRYLELRYQLLPYNYTLMRQACDSGLPPMRALWLHYSEDPEAVKLGDEYLWGRDILVAPVVEKGAQTRRLYLPAGTWYDWWTQQKVNSSGWIERPVDLATMPLYARAGAIVPLDPVRQYTAQAVNEPTLIKVFPGANGEFVLYDDDGFSLEYQRGLANWTRFEWDEHQRMLTVEPDRRSKASGVSRREFVIEMVSDKPLRKTVVYTGSKLQVKF